jgi:hypothetical protein
LSFERLLDRNDHDFEAGWIVDRHLRELLSVQFDIRQGQAGDQLAVTQAVQSRSSVHADDPKPTEVTSSSTAVPIGEAACSDQVFFRSPVETATTADITFCPLKHPPLGLTPGRTFSRSHDSSIIEMERLRSSRGLLGGSIFDWQTKVLSRSLLPKRLVR